MTTPEEMLADGDSWNGYPWILETNGGLADHLAAIRRANLTNLAINGDSSEEVMGLKNCQRLRQNLPGKKFILMSMGGDDFAGDQFRLALQNFDGDIGKAVNWDWFSAAVKLIIEDYKNLREVRDAVAPACLIVSHSYGFPPPEMIGRAILGGFLPQTGPWLQPGFLDRGWTNPDDQSAILKLMLLELERRLAAYAATDPLHLHVNLQTVLQPQHWGNELHLTDEGWQAAAMELDRRITAYFTAKSA